uniref:Uncharacterized protein n=1 Tax=Rhodosorus marinus TaxID=101924 RepID=A0A7S3A0L6_9RHOD|mmetsp:Transcript_40141/g.159585  ORF Transcript_40141/g.159585 Transcript_40141/m.159585 type:complete len:152 (+) Transcript_40141:1987-2442(+)
MESSVPTHRVAHAARQNRRDRQRSTYHDAIGKSQMIFTLRRRRVFTTCFEEATERCSQRGDRQRSTYHDAIGKSQRIFTLYLSPSKGFNDLVKPYTTCFFEAAEYDLDCKVDAQTPANMDLNRDHWCDAARFGDPCHPVKITFSTMLFHRK